MMWVLSANSLISDDGAAIAMDNDRLCKKTSTFEHWNKHYAKNTTFNIASSSNQSSNDAELADI